MFTSRHTNHILHLLAWSHVRKGGRRSKRLGGAEDCTRCSWVNVLHDIPADKFHSLTLDLNRDMNPDFEGVFLSSSAGGGGSGFGASKVPLFEGSTFFHQGRRRRRKYIQWAVNLCSSLKQQSVKELPAVKGNKRKHWKEGKLRTRAEPAEQEHEEGLVPARTPRPSWTKIRRSRK